MQSTSLHFRAGVSFSATADVGIFRHHVPSFVLKLPDCLSEGLRITHFSLNMYNIVLILHVLLLMQAFWLEGIYYPFTMREYS